MQDRYVGDLGDFGKYGLLRGLFRSGNLSKRLVLGVLWYLVPDESHNADGKHVNYLIDSRLGSAALRSCDPALFDALSNILKRRARTVAEVETSNILPSTTLYFRNTLDFRGVPRSKRKRAREGWFAAALEATRGADVVFLDPDNGLQTKTPATHLKGPKFAYYSDLSQLVARGQSLIIYHHICRQGAALDQVRRRLRDLREIVGPSPDVFALLYRRGSCRAYLFVDLRPRQLHRFAREFLQTSWGAHFDWAERG
jgi:hypothetical protein